MYMQADFIQADPMVDLGITSLLDVCHAISAVGYSH